MGKRLPLITACFAVLLPSFVQAAEIDDRFAVFDEDAVNDMVQRAENDFFVKLPAGIRDPANLLATELANGNSISEAAATMGQAFDLTKEAAEDLAFGLFVTVPSYRVDEHSADLRASAEAALYRVVSLQPQLPAVWARIGRLAEVGRRDCDDGKYLDSLFVHGVELALDVYELEFCFPILARALQIEPDSLELLEQLQTAISYNAATDIALAEHWRNAVERTDGALDDLRFRAFAALVVELGEAGLVQEVLQVMNEAPTVHRQRVAVGTDALAAKVLGIYLNALLLEGRRDEAAEHLGRVRNLAADCEQQRVRDCRKWRTLETILEEGDAFDVAKASAESFHGNALLNERLVYGYLVAHEYGEIARHHKETYEWYARSVLEDEDPMPGLFDPLGQGFHARETYYQQRIKAVYADLPPQDAELQRVVPATPRAPDAFSELPLSRFDGTTDCTNVSDEQRDRISESLELWLVRMQKCGDTMVALGMSQSLDPVGETSPGGYWLALTENDGRTWRQVYTGLRVNAPYVAKAESEMPLLRDGKIVIHADVREVDPASITFPPVGMRLLRSADNIVLVASLEALTRDTDADNLSDLAEGRMQLDVSNPDSDGDGEPDGFDLLPTVPKGDVTTRGAALSIALEHMFGYERGALIEGVNRTGVAQWMESSHLPLSRTLFFVTDEPELFQGQIAPFRMVVLSPEQERSISKEVGLFLPLQLNDFWFSKDGSRALLKWSARWRGGVIYLEKTSSGWTKEILSDWIS